jgi:hypothetical protein
LYTPNTIYCCNQRELITSIFYTSHNAFFGWRRRHWLINFDYRLLDGIVRLWAPPMFFWWHSLVHFYSFFYLIASLWLFNQSRGLWWGDLPLMCIVHDLRFTSATKCMLEKGAVLEVFTH